MECEFHLWKRFEGLKLSEKAVEKGCDLWAHLGHRGRARGGWIEFQLFQGEDRA